MANYHFPELILQESSEKVFAVLEPPVMEAFVCKISKNFRGKQAQINVI